MRSCLRCLPHSPKNGHEGLENSEKRWLFQYIHPLFQLITQKTYYIVFKML